MELVKHSPEQRAPLDKGVLIDFDRVRKVISPGQKQILASNGLSCDTSRLSQGPKSVARRAKYPKWLTIQELHYIEHVDRLLSYEVVKRKGIASREDVFNNFPVMAPIERLGLQKRFCTILRHDLRNRLDKEVSIGYIREFFSLGINEKELFMKARLSKSLIREINRKLMRLGLPSLDDSEERKMLSHFVTKTMQHYRNGLTQRQIMWLDTVKWGSFSLSDIFIKAELSDARIKKMKKEVRNHLIYEPIFNKSPFLEDSFAGEFSEFERDF